MADQNRKILVLDDEPGVLDAYRIILSPVPLAAPIVSSRRRGGAAAALAVAPAPASQTAIFEAVYVSSGAEALQQIEEGVKTRAPFAGGFFDVKLGPGMDGIETIAKAKEIDPNLLCCIVTAYQDRNVDEITKIFGEEFADRWDFLTKPFNHGEILQKARNLVSNWERRRREKAYLEQIQSQQQIIIAQERLAAMGQLARSIGHEFGNILLRIIGKAEVARQGAVKEDMAEALKVIATAAERAGVIVRNLNGLVKSDVHRELGDIREPLADSLQLIEHELRKDSVNVTEHYDGNLPQIPFNRVEISQVLLNLMINAAHAMEQTGGELYIRTFAEGNGVCIELTDTGCGIAPEHLDQIFEPLFTTKGEKGSGIGLAVSKKIMESHEGRIEVKSEVGKGTTFTLWLPLESKT